MKKIVLIYIVVATIIFVASCFTLNNKMQMQNTSKTKSTVACVLQDAVCNDGIWHLFGRPCVFDEQSSEIMAQLMNGKFNCQVSAYAELINNCYVIHLD